MNILIPYHWLLDHLDTKATPQEIQKYLSLCGPSVERINEVNGEPVFDIETTTNRVDATSVIGIAREAATILPEFGIKASLKPLELAPIDSNQPLDIEIVNDNSLCQRIVAVKLDNVRLGSSPEWIQKRLVQVGQRPLNNAIDITNYVMWEVGHPVHAFDYDRLISKKIIVRQAKQGEKLITLDNKIHSLSGGEVVFDDGKGEIIDLPGIMGTANTVVSEKTTRVLLWIESVDAVRIRQASMGLSIRSQAAVLNEKGVDPDLAMTALLRGVQLYKDITNARPSSSVVDIYPHRRKPEVTNLSQNHIDTYLGISIKPERISRILENLGCSVKVLQDTKHNSLYEIIPPTWRINDLTIPQDYIEEIARIYGYHNLPSVIMSTPIPDNPVPEDFHFENQIKQWLAGWGAQEVYTYSMVSEKLAIKSGIPIENHLKIANPLSDDWIYMRRSLIPSLMEVLEQNPTQITTLFEMQNIYVPQGNQLPIEQLRLSLVTNHGYSHLKGLLDALIIKLHITESRINQKTGIITAGKHVLGIIAANSLDVDMKVLQQLSHTHPTRLTQKNFPPIIEDLTFTFPLNMPVGPIMETIAGTHQLIESVTLKEVYTPQTSNHEPRTNNTFTIVYRHTERPLTDKEIAPIRKHIVATLDKDYSAKLVGQV